MRMPNNNIGDCDGCSFCCERYPIEKAKQLLESSFFAALKEVHVEKIKKIIERDWGRHHRQDS